MSKKRLEQFPISEDAVKNFIESNNRNNFADIDSDKFIYINFSMVRMQTAWIIPKILFAKGLAEKEGATVIALTWSENPLLSDFFKSFGIRHISFDNLDKKNLWALIKAAFKTVGLILTGSNGEKLKELNALGMNVGMAFYEDVLRTSALSTLRNCRSKVCIKKVLHLLTTVYSLDDYLKKCKPVYAVTDDMAYHENAFIRIFMKNGAEVHACSNKSESTVELNECGHLMRHGDIMKKRCRDEFDLITDDMAVTVDAYMEERFKGNNGRDIDRAAFAGKRVLTKEQLCEEYGINPDKKTVVIMAHTFTDAVFNYGEYPFRDYYDWTEGTLKIAADNTAVNWILKPHPTRKAYNENSDSIEDMFTRLKKDHMFFLNDDVSAESIKNIADVIVTVGGNAGAEFACFGVPCVILGKPYYQGYGYTVEPKSYDDYKNVLNDIQNMKQLSPEQILTAKKVFYLASKPMSDDRSGFSDEFSELLNKQYTKMCDALKTEYFAGNDGTEKYNTEILDFVTKYFSENDVRTIEYYRRGKENVSTDTGV